MADVTALRRPPVRQSVLVRCPREHTFETFVAKMGVWWPVNPFSAGKDRVRDVAEDCALPGGYLGGSFDKGWAFILGKLAEAAEGNS
jgi:hypothetical protein